MAEVDVTQVAQFMNVSVRRVQQLVQEGMPQISRGRYDLGRCLHWYIRWLQNALERRSIADSSGVTSLTAERVKLAREAAQAAALANQKRRGEVVDAKWILGMLQRLPVAMHEGHTTVINRCPHEFAVSGDPQRIKERLAEELRSVEGRLASVFGELADHCDRLAASGDALRADGVQDSGSVGGREADSAEGISGAGAVPELADAVHDASGSDGDLREVPPDSGGDGSANGQDRGPAQHSGS